MISKIPFGYRRDNTGRRIESYDRFFTYELGSNPGLTIDGELADEDLGEPFFTDRQPVASGHPQGTTYGRVTDDGEHLYVAIDFTPDNTEDDGLDYAKVIARTGDGVPVFRVSIDWDWGKAGFTYTDKVGYQHLVYEFEIPLSELEIVDEDGAQPAVELAFTAYGTAAPPVVRIVAGGSTEAVNATAPPGYRFAGWTRDGQAAGEEPEIVIRDVMTDMTIVANIASLFTVTFITDGTEGASLDGTLEQAVPAGGSTEAVTAVGTGFVEWTSDGDVLSAEPTIVIHVNADL